MPWKECSVMDERLKFVARRLAGEPMSELCREFGISRKTGYKIFDRYEQCGVQGLSGRSRRPYRSAHQLPFQVEYYIVNVKHEHPSWGSWKIRERLRAQGTTLSLNDLWLRPHLPAWRSERLRDFRFLSSFERP
jgi:transposase